VMPGTCPYKCSFAAHPVDLGAKLAYSLWYVVGRVPSFFAFVGTGSMPGAATSSPFC